MGCYSNIHQVPSPAILGLLVLLGKSPRGNRAPHAGSIRGIHRHVAAAVTVTPVSRPWLPVSEWSSRGKVVSSRARSLSVSRSLSLIHHATPRRSRSYSFRLLSRGCFQSLSLVCIYIYARCLLDEQTGLDWTGPRGKENPDGVFSQRASECVCGGRRRRRSRRPRRVTHRRPSGTARKLEAHTPWVPVDAVVTWFSYISTHTCWRFLSSDPPPPPPPSSASSLTKGTWTMLRIAC
ncbi:uncharacterized protein LOC122266078 [Penaeus japonicus]|uniref:uncharacterized protein LOC122266078 n=1 Tax=Penaeus japonicus TaxID=27405 RepID=UPI001C712EDF|nr:uncharacterized protein LOC122266078 [Penaeus japonicus]